MLITAAVGKIDDAQDRLLADGVQQVDAVSGAHGLVAVLEAEDVRQIGRTVLRQIQRTEGVLDTVTLLQLG